MRRTPVALIPLVVSAILAGCVADQETTGPRTIAPRAASSGNLALVCDANAVAAIGQDGKKWFPNNDVVFNLITAMKQDLKTSVAAATPNGFKILARTAEVRRLGIQTGTNIQGGTFVLDVIGCMSVGAIPDAFHPDLALGYGIFEVRTGAVNEGPTVAYTALAAKSTAAASPEWGAEAASPTSGPLWPPVVNSPSASTQYVVYGYPLGSGVLTSGFELSSVPVPKDQAASLAVPYVDISLNPLAVGVCTPSTVTVTGGKKAAKLLNHNGTVLNLQKLNFCPINVGTNSGHWLRSLPGRLLALVKPTTLFAQDEDTRFVGGLPSGWTPNTINQFISTDITLQYFTQPIDAKLSGPLVHIVVEAIATTVPPLNVRLAIANNNGTPAFLTTAIPGDALLSVTAPVIYDASTGNPTSGKYVATFDIGFTKAGGYTLSATGYIGGGSVTTPVKVSNLFNVKNQ